MVGLRSPDSALNPYLAFSLILAAGLEGIEKGKRLPSKTEFNLNRAPQEKTKALSSLPLSLEEALVYSSKSEFVRGVLGEQLVQSYIEEKKKEISDINGLGDIEKLCDTGYFKDL